MDSDNTLQLLIIDESSNDAESITNILRSIGLAVRPTRVEDDEDLETALTEKNWDLIITADKLTYIDAYKALEILQKSERDIPLIIAANGTENITVGAALKAGACDLVHKDEDPEHLQYVVQRELRARDDRRKIRQYNKASRESEKRCRSLLDSSRDAITYVHEGMHIYANPVYMEMFGYDDPDEIEGMPIMDMVSPDDHEAFKKFLRQFTKNESEMKGDIEVSGLRTDGNKFSAVMEFTPASVDGESCTQIIIRTASDKELQNQLNILSQQDLLTGIYNRQHFMEVLESTISKVATESSHSALLYIDIDDFAAVKQNVGLASSDLVLSDIAKVISDLVEAPDIVARFSDHSFTLLINETSSNSGVEKYANTIRQTIEDHISEVGGNSVTVTCSIGISPIGENTSNTHEIISRADLACSIAKENGGNSIHLHNPVADEQAGKERNAGWIDAINNALTDDNFFLAFQPIVSLHGDTCENYEVLLRMHDVDNNQVLPEQFLPAAEQAELMPQIDRWVITHAMQRLASVQAEGGAQTKFFIKLAGASLTDNGLLPWISEQLKEQRLSGDSLIFELDESSAVMYLAQAKNFINGVKQLHCQVVLDHFGSGLNSIKNLKHLDANYLKIDGSLISNLASDDQNQETVQSIIQTAHSMGKLTIAEFVQDANSLALLWQFGVNYIQGHFLQEPSTSLDYDFSSEDDDE
ncbi:MAG: EAL domain-containing protein [Sulfuriflexus sp.]|nr:EAL domain-containing protein [Sulfuriflexus sp.]